MKAKIKNLEQFYSSKKGFAGDHRKKGVYTVFSYFTPSGVEFRRGYWFPAGTPEAGIFDRVPHEIEVTL